MTITTITDTSSKIPSPYKLLDYYGYEDAGLFFGREAETRQMVGEILSSRLLVLYSPSGSGKTSLIQAGVRPQLEEMGYRTVYTRMEAEPIPSVTRAVSAALKLPDGPTDEHRDLDEFLKKKVQASGKPLVIFLDQFEEFFIVYRNRPGLRREFIEQVARVKYDDEMPAFLVLSLREDYLAHLHEFRRAIPSIFQNNANIRLEAFDVRAGRRAMEKPLEATGWLLASDLADTLVKDLNNEGSGIEPIRLQMVCGALWEQRPRQPGEIPLAVYEALEGAETIIRRFIAGRLEKVPRSQHKLMVRVCEALKTPDDTKRYRSYEDLRTQLHIKKSWRLDAVLKPLVNLQVLREEERSGTRWYEFKHDYVAAELSQWIQDREERTRRRQLKRLWLAVFPGLILFLALLTYFFIRYNTFYAGFNIKSYPGQQEEIIISRGFSFSGQTISTGLFLSDVEGHVEINKLRKKFKISFWDQDNWLALADILNIGESGKFLYHLGQTDMGIQKLVEALKKGSYYVQLRAAAALGHMGKADQKVIRALSWALYDENEYLREQVAESLAQLGKTNQNAIINIIDDPFYFNEYVQSQLVDTLVQLGKTEQKVIDLLLKALNNKNKYVRYQAACTLVKLGKADRNIIDILLHALKDEYDGVQCQAAEALGHLGKADQKVIDALLLVLKDYNIDLSSQAAEALGHLGKADQKVIDGLIRELDHGTYKVKGQAAIALVRLENVDQTIIDTLFHVLIDENNWIRRKDTDSLGPLEKEEPKVIDYLIKALMDKTADVWEHTVEIMVRLVKEEPKVIDYLIKALMDKTADVREQAVEIMLRLVKKEPKVINALLLPRKDKSYKVWVQHTATLGRLGEVEPKVIPVLLQALKVHNRYKQGQAAAALGLIGNADQNQNVIVALLQAQKDNVVYARGQVAAALGLLGKADNKVIDTLLYAMRREIPYKRMPRSFEKEVPGVIDTLLLALKVKNYRVREQAAEIMNRLLKEDPNIMYAILNVLKEQYIGVRLQAIDEMEMARQRKAEPKIIDVFLQTLKDKDSSVRAQAAESLVTMGKAEPKVIAALLQALKDENTDVCKEASAAMSRFWQYKSEDELINMLEDTRSEFRTAAAYALAQKEPLSPETLQKINTMKDSSSHPWVRLGAWKAYELIQEKEEKE